MPGAPAPLIAPTPRHPTALPSRHRERVQGKRGIGEGNKGREHGRVQVETQAAELDAAHGRAALGLRSCSAPPPPPLNGLPSANASEGRGRVAPTEQPMTMRTEPTSPMSGHVRVRGRGGSVTSVRFQSLSEGDVEPRQRDSHVPTLTWEDPRLTRTWLLTRASGTCCG